MTTRQQLRVTLRRALEDTNLEALWPDDALNDALVFGMNDYGSRFPAQRSTLVVTEGGTTDFIVAAVAQGGGRMLRLIDPDGQVVLRNWSDETPPPGTQRWRWWQGAIRLDVPAVAGTWRVEYLSYREMPSNDTDPVDIAPADEPILVAFAMVEALHRQARVDAKRGLASGYLGLAARVRGDVERLIRARQRSVRGGVLAAAE
ncbi:MAG TPA: hypothetical protein VGT61_12085 [Thermomicrobiales bacterium]|jgi:hypothetical protein|nr:hypothetical protein [Thermomicrobiales bacterium]